MWITNCAYKSNDGQSVPLQICLCRVKRSPAGLSCKRFIVGLFTKNAGFDLTDEFKPISHCTLNKETANSAITSFLYIFKNIPHLVIFDSLGLYFIWKHWHWHKTPPLPRTITHHSLDTPAFNHLRCPVRGCDVLHVRVSSWLMCWGPASCPRLWPCHDRCHSAVVTFSSSEPCFLLFFFYPKHEWWYDCLLLCWFFFVETVFTTQNSWLQ